MAPSQPLGALPGSQVLAPASGRGQGCRPDLTGSQQGHSQGRASHAPVTLPSWSLD